MRENIYGPENRVLSARLSQVTVKATASYSNGKETGTTLTVRAAGSTSAVPYRNVPKVASSGTPLSLIIAVVPDAGEHARVAVGKATLKAMALQGLTEKIPSDLYSAYCGTFLSSIIGKAAHSLRTSCTVSLDGRMEAVYDEYSRGLYPDTKYPYRNVYSYVVTGVPLCGGGLGTTTLGHDDTIEWGTSYDYSSFGLATLHTTCAEKESTVGVRYDPDTSRFFLTHYSVRTEGGVRYFKEETHDYSTVTYGSYGTFNVWDTCTYAQQFTRTTTSQSVNEGYTKEDIERFTLTESPLPEAGTTGVYAIVGLVTLDTSNIEADSVGGVFPCTVDVTANQWTVRLQGTFDTATSKLRTLLYNPLDVLYPDIIDTASPLVSDPLSNFYGRHNTPLACNPPEGFYYCYAASGVVTIAKSDVLSYVEVPERGKLATVFRVALPTTMTARYFICTAAMLEEDKAKTLLRVGMDPEYIANTEMTEWDVEVRAAYAVLRGISNAATVAYGHFTRAADLGVRVDEGTVVATVDLWREAAGSGPSNMMGVTVTYMPAEHRGTKITRNRQVPGWLAMSPYGFEGYGSGVTSSITEEVPDTTTLSWASSAANVTDVLEYSGLCDSYSSVTNKVGTYTNSYARPMDTVTETDSYTVKASVGEGYSLLYPSNAKAFLVQNIPKVTRRGHKYTETREAAVAAPMIRVGEYEVFSPITKDIVLRDADGSSLTLLSLSFSGISTAYTTVRGVIESMTVTEAGTLTATCPAGTLDPSVLCSTLAQKPSVGVCKERIGLVYDAFLLAGDTLLCKKPPSVASTVFSPYDPEYSPYGVFVVRTASVEGYSSSMGMTFDLNDYNATGSEDYRSPNGWEFRIVDAVTGKVAKVLTGPFYSGNQVGFSVPTWEASMPPLWYCLVAPYILSGGKKYYGQDVFTGPTLGFPTRMSFVGGTLVDRYHRIDRIYGENSYYGGSPPGAIPASQDNEAEYVMELAYLPTQNIIPSIGVGAAVQVWDIGEPVRYRPFIWFSSIKGAEGYCVGARAVSTQYLPTLFSKVRVKSTAAEILTVVETEKNSNDSAIASLVATGGTGEANLAKIADLRDFATILGTLVSAVKVMVEEEEEEVRVAAEEERDPVPLDMDRVYSLFIDTANSRVILLRNDFASYELLFAAAQQTTGCGFVQQAPGGSEPALMTSAWF